MGHDPQQGTSLKFPNYGNFLKDCKEKNEEFVRCYTFLVAILEARRLGSCFFTSGQGKMLSSLEYCTQQICEV